MMRLLVAASSPCSQPNADHKMYNTCISTGCQTFLEDAVAAWRCADAAVLQKEALKQPSHDKSWLATTQLVLAADQGIHLYIIAKPALTYGTPPYPYLHESAAAATVMS